MGYNKITLGGNQVCDYLYVTTSKDELSQFEHIDVEPNVWASGTLMLAKFNFKYVLTTDTVRDGDKVYYEYNEDDKTYTEYTGDSVKGKYIKEKDMSAGNSSLTNTIEGYEVRRRSEGDLYTEYVGTVRNESEDLNPKNYLIDYMVKNNTNYTYYLYPTAKYSDNGIVLHPSVAGEIKTDWAYWSLLLVDETEEENVFYLNKMFKFELNMTTDAMGNNAVVSVLQNFTKYPTVQYGTSNYWSGSLSALCGYVSCGDSSIDYVQTPRMIDELKKLTSDTRRKFLKDVDGNVWEVKITAPITITAEDKFLQSVKTVKISWTEVGDTSGISIINNPNTTATSWILTETGEVAPYIDYVWDDDSHWNNSYRWTAREDVLRTEESNLGRKIYYAEGGDDNA